MLRTDGKYNIYIIKHLYKDDPKNGWSYSGDCYQWTPKKITFSVKYAEFQDMFRPFSASGKCWQKTGIHGSYNKKDAIKILNVITKWQPNHRFKVCRLVIEQFTEDVVEMKYK